jgi:3-deoxy-manno-octulosonate cytidylyltransferase (CMP-KDO synthetase)
MKACVIIPARFSSKRFPGKPLVLLLGKPMIIWVAELSARAVGKNNVYVATDDERISKVVTKAGYSVLMTSAQSLTGTDRLAEAAQMIEYDVYINVQGDEPLVDPVDIQRCIALKIRHPNTIINGYCYTLPHEDPGNINIPIVITNESNILVYISRAQLPGFKDQVSKPLHYKKQVCIYGFSRDELIAFSEYGRKSTLESFEDIEILRFLELNRDVLMYECKQGSLAVDIMDDVPLVEAKMRLNGLTNK